MGEQYICQSCSYKWTSRKDWGEPSVCPSCRSDNILTAGSYREMRLEEAKEQRRVELEREELEKKLAKKRKFKKKQEEKEKAYKKKQVSKGLKEYKGRWIKKEIVEKKLKKDRLEREKDNKKISKLRFLQVIVLIIFSAFLYFGIGSIIIIPIALSQSSINLLEVIIIIVLSSILLLSAYYLKRLEDKIRQKKRIILDKRN